MVTMKCIIFSMILICLATVSQARPFTHSNAVFHSVVKGESTQCGMFGGCSTKTEVKSITFKLSNGNFVRAKWFISMDDIDLTLPSYCLTLDLDKSFSQVYDIVYGNCP